MVPRAKFPPCRSIRSRNIPATRKVCPLSIQHSKGSFFPANNPSVCSPSIFPAITGSLPLPRVAFSLLLLLPQLVYSTGALQKVRGSYTFGDPQRPRPNSVSPKVKWLHLKELFFLFFWGGPSNHQYRVIWAMMSSHATCKQDMGCPVCARACRRRPKQKFPPLRCDSEQLTNLPVVVHRLRSQRGNLRIPRPLEK